MRSSRPTRWTSCALRFSTVSSSSLRERPRRSRRVTQRLSPGRGMVDQLRQPRALELPAGDHVDEDTDGAGLAQAVFLDGDILVRGRHAGIAEDVSLSGRPGRLFNARFGDGAKGTVLPVSDFLTTPLFVSILQTVSKRAAIFPGHVMRGPAHPRLHSHTRLSVISGTNLVMTPFGASNRTGTGRSKRLPCLHRPGLIVMPQVPFSKRTVYRTMEPCSQSYGARPLTDGWAGCGIGRR